MLRKSEAECPFPVCRLTRRRVGVITRVYDLKDRLVEIRCDIGRLSCPLLPALAVHRGPLDADLSAAIYLIDLFGEDG